MFPVFDGRFVFSVSYIYQKHIVIKLQVILVILVVEQETQVDMDIKVVEVLIKLEQLHMMVN